ncbi:MAG: M28 family peptidase [Gemmatimonadaceae bacterium]
MPAHPLLRRQVRCLAAVLLYSACRGESRPRTAFSGDAALTFVRTQLAFGPRIPGSEGHRRAGDWIVEQMRARADTVVIQRWSHVSARGDTLPLRNVLARFRPAAAERILYVTHWDTRPVSDEAMAPADRKLPVPGANDGASGVALFLALGDALKRSPPAVGVDLLFVDGEDYGDFQKDQDVLLGSKYFAEHSPTPGYRPLFGVLWDMIGDASLGIYKEPFSMKGAPEVVDRVWRQAADLGYSRYFIDSVGTAVTDDHVPLLAKGMRVIDVIDIDYCCHHKPTDTIEHVSARSLQIVGDVALALLSGQ